MRLTADRTNYRVGESIGFKVKGNRRFYLFNVDPHTGRALAILPNRLQGKDKIRYSAAKWHRVPNPNLEFYADRAGEDRLIMVAS